MRQHAIPQNILDIEFKLFTKFTVREFVYMAIGVGFGGIFLYFFTLGQIPAIIAFPVFLFSSGMGLFLGLVNINDQKADVFLRNYIWAITHPTQRVWKNEMIDSKVDSFKPELNITQGNNQRDDLPVEGSAEIIGSSVDSAPTTYIENAQLAQIDREEQEQLAKIEQLARSTMQTNSSVPQQNSTPVQNIQIPQQPANQSVITDTNTTSNINNQTNSEIVQPNTVPTTPTTPPTPPTPSVPQPTNIKIDSSTISTYQTELSKQPPYMGNINMKVLDGNNQPLSQIIVVIKDQQGRIISALQSDTNGEVYSNKVFPQGVYSLQLQGGNKVFPTITVYYEAGDLKPFKINSN